jgi:hypothetical protein
MNSFEKTAIIMEFFLGGWLSDGHRVPDADYEGSDKHFCLNVLRCKHKSRKLYWMKHRFPFIIKLSSMGARPSLFFLLSRQ